VDLVGCWLGFEKKAKLHLQVFGLAKALGCVGSGLGFGRKLGGETFRDALVKVGSLAWRKVLSTDEGAGNDREN
jgi:hypothetical protein